MCWAFFGMLGYQNLFRTSRFFILVQIPNSHKIPEMPYGHYRRHAYKSHRRPAVAANRWRRRFPVKRTVNKPVRRALHAPRVNKTTRTGRNVNAITTLGRQVKSLQNNQWGLVQKKMQGVFLEASSISPQDPNRFRIPTRENPLFPSK